MKKRVKTDNAILSFVIILTGFLCLFPRLYGTSLLVDDLLDFFGLMVVLSGTYLRMAARGFKKANSKKGGALVIAGPYRLTRNPMYLGSFLMGAGFILIVWPWWMLPFFAALFYLRFNKQIVKEEKKLTETFGDRYKQYLQDVPRLFPSLKTLKNSKFSEIFPPELCWNTKEKGGLLGWPLVACFLETLQEGIVFKIIDLDRTVYVFLVSAITFAAIVILLYKIEPFLDKKATASKK